HVGAPPVLEAGPRGRGWRARARGDGRRHRVRGQLLAHLGAQLLTALGVDPPDLLLDPAAEAVEPELLYDALHCPPAAVLPLPMAVLHADDRLAPDEHIVGRNEVGHVLGQERLGAETPTGEHREPPNAVTQLGVEPDVVHRSLRAVLPAALDGDLELPRQREI